MVIDNMYVHYILTCQNIVKKFTMYHCLVCFNTYTNTGRLICSGEQ